MSTYENITVTEMISAMGEQMDLVKRGLKLEAARDKNYNAESALITKLRGEERNFNIKQKSLKILPFLLLFYVDTLALDKFGVGFLYVLISICALLVSGVLIMYIKNAPKKTFTDSKVGAAIYKECQSLLEEKEALESELIQIIYTIYEATPFIPVQYCDMRVYATLYDYVSSYRANDVTSLINLYESEQHRMKTEGLYEELLRENQATKAELQSINSNIRAAAVSDFLYRITK